MIKSLLLFPVRLYRYCISPFLPARCIHTPTCSEYMQEAVEVHGAWRGILLGLRRLLRCHPFARGGYDPVPEASHSLHTRSPDHNGTA
jgi:hypothetical protein